MTTAAGVPLPRRGWRDRAECAGTDPVDWYAPAGTKVTDWHRRHCHRCPVFVDCAADAIDHRDRSVIRAATALPDSEQGARRKLARVLGAAGAELAR